jgi:hypothetical protein
MNNKEIEAELSKIFGQSGHNFRIAMPKLKEDLINYVASFKEQMSKPKMSEMVYIEVSVKDELPPITWRGFVITDREGMPSRKLATLFEGGWLITNSFDGEEVTHWLKEVQSTSLSQTHKKTLQECKDEVAKDMGYSSWELAYSISVDYFHRVCELYLQSNQGWTDEDMRKCFLASREVENTSAPFDYTPELKYSFEDYFKSLPTK